MKRSYIGLAMGALVSIGALLGLAKLRTRSEADDHHDSATEFYLSHTGRIGAIHRDCHLCPSTGDGERYQSSDLEG